MLLDNPVKANMETRVSKQSRVVPKAAECLKQQSALSYSKSIACAKDSPWGEVDQGTTLREGLCTQRGILPT